MVLSFPNLYTNIYKAVDVNSRYTVLSASHNDICLQVSQVANPCILFSEQLQEEQIRYLLKYPNVNFSCSSLALVLPALKYSCKIVVGGQAKRSFSEAEHLIKIANMVDKAPLDSIRATVQFINPALHRVYQDIFLVRQYAAYIYKLEKEICIFYANKIWQLAQQPKILSNYWEVCKSVNHALLHSSVYFKTLLYL